MAFTSVFFFPPAFYCKQMNCNVSLNNTEQFRLGKRRRLLVDESEENYESEDDIPSVQNDECLFEDLCKDVTFPKEDKTGSKSEVGSWGLLDGLVLARVFHFLRTDLKSLVHAESTCKHWRCVSKFYKNLCVQADLSSVASSCTDSVICSILVSFTFLLFLIGSIVWLLLNMSVSLTLMVFFPAEWL